jgi:hypothetical protein
MAHKIIDKWYKSNELDVKINLEIVRLLYKESLWYC